MKHSSKLFILWILQALAALLWLANLPTNTERGIVLGFSASRLALMGVMLALGSLSAGLYWYQRRSNFVLPARVHKPLYILAVIASVSAPAALLVLRALGNTSAYLYTAYAGRLAPLAAWLTSSAFELAIILTVGDDHAFKANWPETKLFFRNMLFALIGLALVVIFIVISRLGITPYNDGSWGEPTTPLLEWQIILALLV